MADHASTTRRRFLIAGAGALASTAAVAVPAIAAVHVRGGSPSFSIPPEVMAAIQRWRDAELQRSAAWEAYLEGRGFRSEWESTDFTVSDAMDAMHEALRRKLEGDVR